MASRTIIDNASGSLEFSGGQLTLPAPTEAGQILMGNTAGAWAATLSNPSFKNRIINGDMRVAQRGTAAVTANASYVVDRFLVYNSTSGTFSSKQDNSVVPSGFTSSMCYTATSITSPTGTQKSNFSQAIEGINIQDFQWGTSSAKPITISFWVKSSVIGTFGISLKNRPGLSRLSYIAEYSISTTNWEKKQITINGPTTGEWPTDIQSGLLLDFVLCAGPTGAGATSTWLSGVYHYSANQANLHSVLNSTFYITGVQLEIGSVATSFEMRPEPLELQLCQRYFQRYTGYPTTTYASFASGVAISTSAALMHTRYPVTMRAQPTLSINSTLNIFSVGGYAVTSLGTVYYGDNSLAAIYNASLPAAGRACYLYQPNNLTASIDLSAEL